LRLHTHKLVNRIDFYEILECWVVACW